MSYRPIARGSPTNLVNRLSQAMQQSAFRETKSFIPTGELETLICRSAIRKELSTGRKGSTWTRAANLKKRYTLAFEICPWHVLKSTDRPKVTKRLKLKRPEFKKIFAILVLMNRVSEITKFITHAVTDEKLPLVRSSEGNRESLVSQSEPGTALGCFENWDTVGLDLFDDYQWRVLAPVFSRLNDEEAHHMNFDVAQVLPFCKWTCYARGGSACIYMAEIHAQHNKLEGNPVSLYRKE